MRARSCANNVETRIGARARWIRGRGERATLVRCIFPGISWTAFFSSFVCVHSVVLQLGLEVSSFIGRSCVLRIRRLAELVTEI